MSSVREVDIPTEGMHCRSCETLIELTVGEMVGVRSVAARAAQGVTHVAFDPEAVSIDEIVGAIRRIGYAAKTP